MERAAASIAALIGADADEITFASGASEADNLALLGIGRGAAGGKRNRILVSATEHKSILAPCRALQVQCGYRIEHLPVDHEGFVVLDTLRASIADDVLLVSVMAVNNEIGTIQPVAEIAQLAQEHGALFHCDAAQGPCGMDVSTLAAHTDLISLSGHKMYGPKGIGALRIRRSLQECIEPLIYGGGQQGDLRSGTVPVPLCVGMAAAADLLHEEKARPERARLRVFSKNFVQRLEAARIDFALNGPHSKSRHPGNLNMRFAGFDARDMLGVLQPRVAASTGSACTTGTPESSHVLNAIGLSDEEAESCIRFSLGRYTTGNDVDEAVSLVAHALGRLDRTLDATMHEEA